MAGSAPATTGDYGFAQLEQLWIQAGGASVLAPVMAAIALAESSGNPEAINPTDNNGTQTSWGLWQISNGTHNQPDPGILSPLTNAQAAVAKYNSQGLSAWGTYTSGAYQQYLPAGAAAPTSPQAQLTASNTGSGGEYPAGMVAVGANAQGQDAGSIYWPSVVPGVPSQPPTLLPLGNNPIGDLGSIIGWGAEFGAWALFTLVVLIFGILLLALGMALLVVILAGPAVSPLADLVGGGVIGEVIGKSRGKAQTGAQDVGADETPPEPNVSSTPRHAARDDTVQRARHAPGQAGMSRNEEREVRAQARESSGARRSHSQRERHATNARKRARDLRPNRSQVTKQRAG